MHPIRLRGARTHNLQGIDLDLRPGELVGVAGVSGAGKSSLALDTLYSEGQRRFVESFSPYARQFLERLERPPIEALDPVAAGVAVDRHAPVKSSRSTVATMADVEPYFCALFAREAVPICPDHGVAAVRTSPVAAASRAAAEHQGATAVVTYRVPVPSAEAYLTVRESLLGAGYRRLYLHGEARDLDEIKPSEALSAGGREGVEVVVDRVKVYPKDQRRLGAAIEEAWKRAGGAAALHIANGAGSTRVPVVEGLACPVCARGFDPPQPGLFSYQSPTGACPECRGFGRTIGVDWSKVVPDESRTIRGGAVRAWSGASTTWERKTLLKFCEKKKIPIDRPWRDLTPEQQEAVLAGEGTWHGGKYPGVRAWFKWLEGRTYKMHVRVLLARYRSYDLCKACNGKRLSPASLLHHIGGLDLAAWHALELSDARARLDALVATTGQGEIARKELAQRLAYLEKVGLGYLTLDRQARTLSGGEAQRVSLTSALGTSLTGALFVLDEPTVGLHPTDVPPLVSAMRELAAAGNSVVVIEHEPIVLAACDRIVELGPGAGPAGGKIVYDGAPEGMARTRTRTTTKTSASTKTSTSTKTSASAITIEGAKANNLRDVTVDVPLGKVVAVTGPSGSGKSTLVDEVLYRGLARARGYRDVEAPGVYRAIKGGAGVMAVTLVDQAPLGRTSRGNPATYTGAWDRIRAIFGKLPDSVARGLGPGHFSFNVALGRCEACAGEGAETIEMQFLADVSLTCPTCRGRRFKDEVLEVKLDGRSVADVLALSIDEALAFFSREAAIVRALGPVSRLGLGYLALGQPLSTLSGGEAQRIKLAQALGEPWKQGQLFVLDEPSAGLHPTEVARLNEALADLARGGGSVVVVDHDLDVIGAADWVIDLGPGRGGRWGEGGCGGDARGGREGGDEDGEGAPGVVRGAGGGGRGDEHEDAHAHAHEHGYEREWDASGDRGRAREGAQSAGGVGFDPAREDRGGDGAERVGEEHARVRRGVRGGAAALPGDADAVRAAVPADAAAAGRGPGDGGAALDRAGAADDARGVELDGGHRDGNRALPAAALRESRGRALPGLRYADRGALAGRGVPRRGGDEGERGGVRAGRGGAEGDVPRRVHVGGARRDRAGDRGRGDGEHRPAAEAEEERRAHDRSRRVRGQARGARQEELRPRALVREGGRPGPRREGWAQAPLDDPHVPAVRHRRAGARPAVVLVQHQAGPLRGVRGRRRRGRPRGAGLRRSGPSRARPAGARGSRPCRARCASPAPATTR